MDLGLKGKWALITGASQGIGQAIARSLAKEGCNLHLAARNAEALRAGAAGLGSEYGVKVEIHPVDLTVRKAAAALAAECPDVDILVNNAGNTPRGSILEVDEDTWRQGWELKIYGYINLTREIYGRMLARKSGVVVNVIGIGAERLEYAYAAGSAGNAALVAFTRAIGGVSLDYGVRVMGVNPGWVETEKAKRTLRRRALQERGSEELWREMAVDMPRGSLIKPEEVADVVTFACSERSSAVSGTIFPVDAGFSARGYAPPRPAK